MRLMVFCHGSSPCGKYIDKDKIKEKEEERIMKTVIRKFALLLTALTIAVTSSVFVAAQNPSEISLEDFETEYTRLEFMAEAYKQMAEAIKDGAGFTVIYDDIPLYSCYGNIIGYEFAISTDGEEAGYLKLLDYGNGPEFISSSATGVPDYMTYADYIEENSVDGRLYSGSGLWNLIKISDNSFCELGWMDVHSKEAVQDAYARKFAIYNAPEETEDVTVPEAAGAAQSEDTEACTSAEPDTTASTPETFETEHSRLEYLSAAYLYMDGDIKLGGSPHWSVSSEIYDERPVYSCYDKIIGYEFAISTDGEGTGYLMLIDHGKGPEFALSSSLYTPDFIRSADYIGKNSVDGKIYGGLGMYNLIKTSSDSYTVLGWDETLTTEDYQQVYNKAFYRARQNDEEQFDEQKAQDVESTVSEAKLEQLYSMCNYQWLSADDFSSLWITNPNGVTQSMDSFSSPLAAANILKYLKDQEKTSLPDFYSDNAILTGMYVAMDTNNYSTASGYSDSGTDADNIQPGFLSFCQSYAAGTPTATVYTAASDLTEAKLKSYLDEGHLILATANDYTGEKTHSFVIVGYNGSAFYVADGINPGVSAFPLEAISPQQIIAISF